VRGDSEADRLVLEEGIGPVPVRVALGTDGAVQVLANDPADYVRQQDRRGAGRACTRPAPERHPPRCAAEVAGAGPKFLFVGLRNREAVDRIELLDYRALRAAVPDAPTEVFVFAMLEESDNEDGNTYAVYSRMFAPEIGVSEDPPPASATGPLAAYMIATDSYR